MISDAIGGFWKCLFILVSGGLAEAGELKQQVVLHCEGFGDLSLESSKRVFLQLSFDLIDLKSIEDNQVWMHPIKAGSSPEGSSVEELNVFSLGLRTENGVDSLKWLLAEPTDGDMTGLLAVYGLDPQKLRVEGVSYSGSERLKFVSTCCQVSSLDMSDAGSGHIVMGGQTCSSKLSSLMRQLNSARRSNGRW